jgi:hypothetical protein
MQKMPTLNSQNEKLMVRLLWLLTNKINLWSPSPNCYTMSHYMHNINEIIHFKCNKIWLYIHKITTCSMLGVSL